VEPWVYPFHGRLEERWIDSQALTGNPLGDPHRRPLLVQLPPRYDDESQRRYPTVYVLQGLTGQVDMWRNRHSLGPNTPEAIDARLSAPGAVPAIVVYVDAWTRYGGSQFLDSAGTGRYHTYLCEEIVPFVDAEYRTMAAAAHRAVAGHSSGGYGAMVAPMLRPDLFNGLATHAGDALFEVSYGPDLREAARSLRDEPYASFDEFWADLRSRPGRGRKSDGPLLNTWCMATCYSTDDDGTVRLPFELSTGRILPEIWERWLDHDPVRMAPRYGEALRAQRAIWIDAGRDDEYFLDLGAEAFRAELERLGVTPPTVHFELFEGRHGDVDWRFPMAIAWLAERLTPSPGADKG